MSSKVLSCPKCHTQLDATNVQPGMKARCRKCGSVFSIVSTHDPLVGKTLGGYEILEKLGEGGIGAVYKARQVSLSRMVAIKTLKPEFANNASFVARLQREARSAAQISHPNIVQTIDVGSDQGIHFIAMELVQGETLNEHIARKGRLSVPEALDYLEQGARALQRAHEAGIIHRDIKPENLIITKGGGIKLMDFGLAKRPDVDVGVTQEGAIAGTPRYMSPEQGSGKALDGRSDIYSLGATIYHALCGAPPFEGATAVAVILKHVSEPLPPIRASNPGVTPKLAAVIEKMLAKKPDDRYQTPEELLTGLADVRASLTTDMEAVRAGLAAMPTIAIPAGTAVTEKTTPPAQPPPAPAKPTRRRVWRLVGAAAIVLLVAGIIIHGVIQKHAERALEERNQELSKLFTDLTEESRSRAYEDRYQEAVAVFDRFPTENVPGDWKKKVSDARGDLTQEAKARFKGVCADAELLVKEKRYTDARERYVDVAERYGLPEIREEAVRRAQEIAQVMESEAKTLLRSLKDDLKAGKPDVVVITEYNELTNLYPDTNAAREAGDLIRKVTSAKRRAVITVSKDGRSPCNSIRKAVNAVFDEGIIEIQDSAVYEETEIASQRTGVTVRGAKGCAPIVRLPPEPKHEQPSGPFARFKRLGGGGERVRPMFNVQAGWRFENVTLDGRHQGVGIITGGDLTVQDCVFVNMTGPALFLAGRSAFLSPEGPAEKSVKVSNCVFMDFPAPFGMAVLVDQSGAQAAHLDFSNCLVYRAFKAFQRGMRLMGPPRGGPAPPPGPPSESFSVTQSIFANVEILLLDTGAEPGKAWKFDRNCYAPPGPGGYLMDPTRKGIATLKEWQETMREDPNSTLASPDFADEAAGDLSPRPGSPTARAGLGPRADILARIKPFVKEAVPPSAEEGGEHRPRPRPAEAAPETTAAEASRLKARQSVKDLLAKNRFAEAFAACDSIKNDDEWKKERTDRIRRMMDLKKMIVERINASGSGQLPTSLCVRKKDLVGGVITSAGDENLTVKVNGEERRVRWDELTTEEMRWLAERSSNVQNASEQIAIGIYCLEVGLMDKARQHFNYAKSCAKTTAEKDEVKRLLDEVPPAPKPAASTRTEAASPSPASVGKSAPSPPPKTSIERRIKDLGQERRWSEILSLVSGALRERPEDPHLMISAGIAVTEVMEQSMGPKPAGAKKSPLVNWTRGLLSRGLQLDPTHPRAAEAQRCLAYLTNIAEEDKDERRP